jgi:hypothetical protein
MMKPISMSGTMVENIMPPKLTIMMAPAPVTSLPVHSRLSWMPSRVVRPVQTASFTRLKMNSS